MCVPDQFLTWRGSKIKHWMPEDNMLPASLRHSSYWQFGPPLSIINQGSPIACMTQDSKSMT